MQNFLLCGVGGQGTVLASRILASCAIENGVEAKTAETIGMAQRGGSVVSHVRLGNTYSPLIPFGCADIIIGFEPGEVVNNLDYLKNNGIILVCQKEIPSVLSALSNTEYEGKGIIDYLEGKTKCYIIDGEKLCQECGSFKVLNTILVGALAAICSDFSMDVLEKVLEKKVKPQFLELNKKALWLGYNNIRGQKNGK